MRAVKDWNYQAIKMLVEFGASLDCKDKYGFDVAQQAENRGLKTIKEYIDLERGKKQRTPKTFEYTINFEFEEILRDPTESLITKKKLYKRDSAVFPFNDLKGTYVVNYLNYETMQ
eukprot:TRINITY_DN6758_c0_g1_i4.p2 TRINITY_DN6758_c0_g1~~TRINITY_DN6758_c0_g1_i4.p2  ORF type:complete len:116 (-),score=19.25 TRINITY_DN6758_c0_g1_i4:214-561(-)